MDKQLNFYEVDAEYIAYLMNIDAKVPHIDYTAESGHDKFLCGVVLSVNGHDYFAPISSFNTPQRTNMIIKNEQGKAISSIRFSFMIPVPPGAVTVKKIKDEPSPEYRRLLDLELKYCQKNANTIYRLAKHVYNSVVGKKDPVMVKNCCDFKKLETACAEYIKNISDIKITMDFSGGNIDILALENDIVKLNPQMRDTDGDWFYWAFCVSGAAGRTITFDFTPYGYIGYHGPAVSGDLKEWRWAGSNDTPYCFTYSFGENEHNVYFAHDMLYGTERFYSFAKKMKFNAEHLCISEKGREIPFVRFGDG
jgi:protein AbiQ